ncbi:hypothetical protein [Microbulbifer elongatus]|uniref:hypothetical protein n=1 Tax=Microbulbifer elongatus TaxID=86173 RepID=UPI001E33590D|nr:hypothetical protein [Microbulbifer elongatus]
MILMKNKRWVSGVNLTLSQRMAILLLSVSVGSFYFALQVLFAPHLPLVMDEFQGASAIYQSVSSIPYLNFVPYKPVLGYWFQSIFAGSYESASQYIVDLKFGVRLVNACCLGILCWLLLRMEDVFASWSVVYSLVVVTLVSTFIERSAELRVDMLTVWVGMFSSILFVKQRYLFAGTLIGLGFLVSQKIYFFGVAWAGALSLYWVLKDRTYSLLKYGSFSVIGCAIVILLYILVFGVISGSFERVVDALFFTHADIAFGDLYGDLSRFWYQSIERNLLFYCFVFFSLGSAILNLNRLSDEHWKLVVFSLIYVLLCLSHKQPWPYFVPFLLMSALFMFPVASEIWKGSPGFVFFSVSSLSIRVVLPTIVM